MPSRAQLNALAFFTVLGLSASARANPDEQPSLMFLEARAGYGATIGGTRMTAVRKSPVMASVLVSYAVSEFPLVYAYGGPMVEHGGRAAVGGAGGARFVLGPLRLGLGARGVVRPYTLAGADASLGLCMRSPGGVGLCTDLEATLMVLGSDLPKDATATQLQVVVGLTFDAM